MLKTLDILIGATTVLMLFSMAVTVITQALNNLFERRGKQLLNGLAGLLQQLGIPDRQTAERIAETLLKHPMIADAEGGLGTVIHREEFTKLLLDLAGGQGAATLDPSARTALIETLKQNGVADPAETLKNIRAMALQLETSNPELSNHVRDGLAILHEGASDFVARVNSWFDQTIDRVSEAFTKHTHRVTVAAAFVVVLVVQLDIIAVVDRLSIDDQFRNAIVADAAKPLSDQTKRASSNPETYAADPKPYYDLLNTAGLITLPTTRNWAAQLKDTRKYPGMVLSVLLISLGAPFWYNILKDLLGLRSRLAQKDDDQRAQRQSAQAAPDGGEATASGDGTAYPAWLKGERGNLTSVG